MAQKLIQNEVDNLGKIKSNNVIELKASYKTHSRIYIITEACNGGDLSILKRAQGGKFSEQICRLILSQLVHGLRDLNDFDIIHRDLKVENILINFPPRSNNGSIEKGRFMNLIKMGKREKELFLMDLDLTKVDFEVKIADFGFSKYMNDLHKAGTICGTPLYMSPQQLNDVSYTNKVDVWSLGVIFFELLNGSHPFDGKTFK
jgi:serine/threonine protein kinase